MIKWIKKKRQIRKFLREYDMVFYSSYLNKHLVIDSIKDWDNWTYEVYVFDNEQGWRPATLNSRFGHSDYDVREFVKACHN